MSPAPRELDRPPEIDLPVAGAAELEPARADLRVCDGEGCELVGPVQRRRDLERLLELGVDARLGIDPDLERVVGQARARQSPVVSGRAGLLDRGAQEAICTLELSPADGCLRELEHRGQPDPVVIGMDVDRSL